MADTNIKWKRPKEVEPQHKDVLLAIGKKVEKLRTNKKMSALGIHDELGISRNAYRQMERGDIYFSSYNFLKILDYHSIDITTFFKTDIDKL